MGEYDKGMYPKAKPSRFRDQCFKAAWMRAMLHQGYRFPAERFQSASEIDGLPLQWTLGAVLYTMAGRTLCEPATSILADEGGAAFFGTSVVYFVLAGTVIAGIGFSVARSRRESRTRRFVSHA